MNPWKAPELALSGAAMLLALLLLVVTLLSVDVHDVGGAITITVAGTFSGCLSCTSVYAYVTGRLTQRT